MDDDDNPRTERMVDTHEAARILGLKEATLRKQRVYGGGCVFHKFGRAVRYSTADLQHFKALNRTASTSEHWLAA